MQQEYGAAGRLHAQEHNRFIPILALTYGFGVWLALRVESGLWPLWLLAAAVFLGVLLRGLHMPLRWITLPLAVMAALFWTQVYMNPQMPSPGIYNGITATVYGEATERSSGGIAFTLCDVTLKGVTQPGKAYCTLDAQDGVRAGDLFDGAALRFSGSIYQPSGKENANDFDFRLWLYQNNIGYGISSVRDLEILNTPQTAPWISFAARVRVFCQARFQSLMGEQSSLAMAMLLGDRLTLTQEKQTAFQRAGVAHLMAVSGLHVGLLAAALLGLLNLLSLRKSHRFIVLTVFLALYCLVTGFSPASVRASVMLLLVMLARIAGRKPDPLTTLSMAALIVLILNPLDLFSAGFTLSFTAMAGILLLYPRLMGILNQLPIPKWLTPRRKEKQLIRIAKDNALKTRELLAVSLAAQIGVLLPTAAYFHQLPLYGIVFNLFAVPLAGLLVPGYAITLLVSLLPGIGGLLAMPLGWLAGLGSRIMLWLVQLSAWLPYAQIRVPSPNVWACVGMGLAMITVSGYVRASAFRRIAAITLIAVLGSAGAYATRPAALRYHQFATGRADAALIFDGDATVALDVGTYGTEVTDRLLAEGRSLDALILTHLHLDHAQGVQELLEQKIPIDRIYLPDEVEKVAMSAESTAVYKQIMQSGIPITYLAAGDTLRFHEMSIQVLWPQAGRTRTGIDANDRSLATLITLGDLRILSMGDNTNNYELYAATACDILKVGHHGSATATSAAFLQIADPQVALITCWSGSSGPAEATLERLQAAGSQIYRTDETGEIIIEVRGSQYSISTYLTGENHGL